MNELQSTIVVERIGAKVSLTITLPDREMAIAMMDWVAGELRRGGLTTFECHEHDEAELP